MEVAHMIQIVFILITLVVALIYYGIIMANKNTLKNRMPWESCSDRRNRDESFFYDKNIGYDEKLGADMEALNALLTGGGWIRAALQLVLLGSTIAIVFMHPEWPWYARLIIAIPSGGLLAMALFNMRHRK
jgi:hypothetical protein